MKSENDLLSIFGAKVSKDNKKLVLILVSGENENKRYYNACIKLDNSQKTHAKVVDNTAVIEVEMLKDKSNNNDDLPF